jgi:acyl-CoA reductase-like NAD-dependent aldehyde dehydrogenase
LGQLAIEAGIPHGIFNIIPGKGEITGKALALHHDVDGIFFTGSTEVGKLMLQYSGLSNMKRVSLECGGKSPFIVLDGCSYLKEAASTLAQCIFLNQGQTCSAPSRLIVTESVRDELIDYLMQTVSIHQPGNPLDEQTMVGAMVSHEHLKTVSSYVESGLNEGAKLLTGGKNVQTVQGGAYFTPTIFDQVQNNMKIAQEEIFGPVLSIITVKAATVAIKIANESNYGLAAAVWTYNIDIAHQVAREMRAGSVHINSFGNDDITAAFGGYKQSGNGSKDKSLHAIDDYMELKTTWCQLHSIK